MSSDVNTETYIRKIKERASPSGEVLDKIKAAKAHELDSLVIDTEIAKYKKQLQGTDNTQQTATTPPLTALFVGKNAEEIQAILKGLTSEDIQKLQLITANMNTNQLGALLQFVKQPDTTRNDIFGLFKLMLEMNNRQQPQQGITLEGIAALMRAMKETQAPPQPQTDVYKVVMDLTKPLYDSLRLKDREVYDAKLKEIEAKMPSPLDEQIKYVKEMAGALGLGNQGSSELDLKLEELRQNREIDIKKLDWEEKKYEMEQDADSRKWEQIANILKGPVGDVMKSLGAAGADRVRGGRPPNHAGKILKPVQTQCPNCSSKIFVDAEAETAVCGSCGAVLQKQGQQPQPPPAPETTHVEEEPSVAAPTPEPAKEETTTAIVERVEEPEAGPESEAKEQ